MIKQSCHLPFFSYTTSIYFFFHTPHRWYFWLMFLQGIFNFSYVSESAPPSQVSWILDPKLEDHKAIDIQHGHSVPVTFSKHCITMVGHGQLNTYYHLLVLFWVSFPENCALPCQNSLQPLTLNIAFVFDISSIQVHPTVWSCLLNITVFLLFTCPSVFVSHNNFVKTCFFFNHW